MKYVYIKTPTLVMSAHKLLDNQPTTSLALFKIHEIIEPIIPGRAAPAFAANFPSRELSAFNLFFIHSLAVLYPLPSWLVRMSLYWSDVLSLALLESWLILTYVTFY